MPGLEKIGKGGLGDRDLYFLPLDTPRDVSGQIRLSSPHFACLIVWDAASSPRHEVAAFVRPLISAGGAYFCCWGSACKEVETVIDDVGASPLDESSSVDDPVIMTTSHATEPLSEALEFLLTSAWPHEHYEETLSSSLVISVGNDRWADEIQPALRDPKKFIAEMLEQNENTV